MGKPQTVVEVLIAARELISVPERWTKSAYARSADGRPIGPCGVASQDAVCWCPVGAVDRLVEDGTDLAAYALDYLQMVVGGGRVANWNDAQERTHAEVLAAFDKAIELARAEEA
jgi:hypothetical protein